MTIRTIPSLVVGLGGTGKRALTHLKRRIFDTYGVDELPWIRLLSIDTDSATVNNPPVISQRTGEFIKLGTSESRVIDQSDTPQVISNLDAPENRHIKEWYPDPDMKVDFPKAARGSGQIRMFGKIGLHKGDNLHSNYRWLQQAAHEVADPAAWSSFPNFDVDHNVQFVYVICSLCGGTGSGMFLDIAYLLRKIVGVDPSTKRFVGMFVMPEVYEPVIENQHIKRIYANAYAALREMDYLLNSPKRSYLIKGKDHTFVDFKGDVPPFDFVFLFNNKNKRGSVISQRQVSGDKPMAIDDRVAQYMSETIMTDVLSPVTERSESILSNIFTSLGDPEQVGDRTFYKTYSAVGVSSVKIPAIDQFSDLLRIRITDAVIDFLLRPDPDITEKALAKQFWSEHVAEVEDKLVLRTSLSSDASYGRFLSSAFHEEFKLNKPASLDKLKHWVEALMSDSIIEGESLSIENHATSYAKDFIDSVNTQVNKSLMTFAHNPKHGYAFLCEWLEELMALCNQKIAQLPPVPEVVGDPKRRVNEAIESLKRVSDDVQLPILRDTMYILLERLSEYYDSRGRDVRGHSLVVNVYEKLLKEIEVLHTQLRKLRDVLSEVNDEYDVRYSAKIATMGDASSERILIDKSLIGRKETEKFLDGLLASMWENQQWKDPVPKLAEEIKQLIEAELGANLVKQAINTSLSVEERSVNIKKMIEEFVQKKIFDQKFPVNQQTGKIDEPHYTTPDGRSLLLDFAQGNLLNLMVAHSSPLWSVKTHQIGSASQPITFVGLNGTKLPENIVNELQKELPGFRTSDVVLSDAEPRILIKQYDPLYSLASYDGIIDYENYYKNTDRLSNPMHTDRKFSVEPNPYMQWLSYEMPKKDHVVLCSKGHDIVEAIRRDLQFCPHCSTQGIKNLIVKGKIVCPMCQQIVDKGSRKCPECAGLIEGHKSAPAELKLSGIDEIACPGCVTLGRPNPEKMLLKHDPDKRVQTFCPSCGSAWADMCPYCSADLEKTTVCTKGSDRCIFESPPIILCYSCRCPVTPDTSKCPRCFKEIEECAPCKELGLAVRMISTEYEVCPNRHTAVEEKGKVADPIAAVQ
ncbi:MAG: tubulin-like doman-containing protein [Candidatus Melainabacteria bacterium]|nr:tubulin-like doman-containing protein [Candidatus Melainabacteria bacterium]